MRILALAVCLVLTATALPASSWSRDDLPTVGNASTAGSGSFGVKVTTGATSDIVVEANLYGPSSSSVASAGIALTDAAGTPTFAFVFSSVSSPDRSIGVPLESGSLPGGMRVIFTSPENKGQPGTDEACTFLCVAVESDAAAAGDHYYVVWLGGGSGGDVNVKANAGSVAITRGTARTAGDSDITNGDTNTQYQQGGVGVKAMKGASIPFAAPGRVYGLWQSIDFKFLCAYTCVLPVQTVNDGANLACRYAGQSCGTSQVSYHGPQSGVGSTTYFLLGAPAGSYTFNVDLKVDAYQNAVNPFACIGICAGALTFENYDIFSMASVALPA